MRAHKKAAARRRPLGASVGGNDRSAGQRRIADVTGQVKERLTDESLAVHLSFGAFPQTASSQFPAIEALASPRLYH
jgi:hypothetical protein